MINEDYYRMIDSEGNTHTGVVSKEDGFSDIVYYFVSMSDESHAVGDLMWTMALTSGHDFLTTAGLVPVTVEITSGDATYSGAHVVEAVQEMFAGTEATGEDVATMANMLFDTELDLPVTLAFRNA